MPGSELHLAVVREWVQKAENDLTTAVHTLKLREDCPTDAVCFHAQQCVEKYLKAFLVYRGIHFPRVHNIEELVALVPRTDRPDLSAVEQERLTDFATATRYPGDYDPIPLRDARVVVATARRVRRHVRRLLPKTTTVRRRK
ncbi:MAG: HEPN domain-containing protein [Candidatus Hydrogenedentes bacterium]|nr:HEPN domain-containing protein [Candidatus Hydrogenedentota bacterium]